MATKPAKKPATKPVTKPVVNNAEYVDRRMAYFSDMKDVKAKQAALEKAVRKWVRLMGE